MAALSTLALLAVSAAKTGLDYSSQRAAARSVQQQGNEQGKLLDTNAELADAQSADAIARGDQAATGVARQTRMIGGAQRAALAAQGVDVGSGSASDVVQNDQTIGAFDALTIRNNAKREAWGYQTQAGSYRQQAGLARSAGANSANAIRRQSMGTLLGGAAQLYNVWDSAPKGVGTSPVSAPAWLPKPVTSRPIGWNG